MTMHSLRWGVVAQAVVGMVAATLSLAGPAGAEPATAHGCGDVLTTSTKLANDVGPCPGDGLIIGADGIKLDLNGHRVFGIFLLNGAPTPGTASSESAGIRFAGTTRSTVTNGEVLAFAAGVLIDGGSANVVTDIDAHDNIGPITGHGARGLYGDGISAWNSSGNTIEKNLVVHNGPYSGISLVDASDNNTVSDNVVRDNNTEMLCPLGGILGRCTQGQAMFNNDFGIRVEGPDALDNVVARNLVTGSGSNGIIVQPSCSDTFTGGTCAHDVSNSGTIIRDNESDGNGFAKPGPGGNGIILMAMGNPDIHEPSGETVEGNTTKGNFSDGIRVEGSACPNLDPSLPQSCSTTDSTVEHNTSMANGRDGINLGRGTNHITVDHNTVDHNGRDGIALDIGTIRGTVPPVQIPGSGAVDNTIVHNEGMANRRWDGSDATPGCDNNHWEHNAFGVVNQPCVLGSSP